MASVPTETQRTLSLLCTWYDEPSQGGDRPKLLSKLALLELCGWIEGRFDELIVLIDSLTLKDKGWVEQNVTSKTHGFQYSNHFRSMVVAVIGESQVRRIEDEWEKTYPGDLAIFKSLLGTLWTKRCEFAHKDIVGNVAAMTTFDAPSWSSNQYRLLDKHFDRLQECINKVLT